jgi:hypothetical protein
MKASSPRLEMPSYLFGTYDTAHHQALVEGRRCAAHYLAHGAIPSAAELLTVQPGSLVNIQEVSDFVRDQAAWRLYLVRDALRALRKTLNLPNAFHISDMYEAIYRDTPWGALYYATAMVAPYDARSYALRLQAVDRAWEELESVRYIFRVHAAPLSLEELMMDACGWAVTAWCPEVRGEFRLRLRTATERMGKATREECIEAILRQVPHVLPRARGLAHPQTLADLDLWRERLSRLDTEDFSRVSASLTANLLACAYSWDKELGLQ